MNALTLDQLRNAVWGAERLREAGLSAAAAEAKAQMLARAAAELARSGDGDAETPAVACFVPGRIEVLGKHTDYAGGRSLLAAAERGFCAVAVATDELVVEMIDVAWSERVRFGVSADLTPTVGHWSNYPMTAVRRLAHNFPGALHGARIAFASDLPPAAGMSSSSAMVVMTFLLLADLYRLGDHEAFRADIHRREDLAGYLGTIENGQTFGRLEGDRGVGTFGGSEDHTAMLCAQAGRLVQYAYCPVRFERSVPMPADALFAIASSGVAAEKTGAAMEKYNRASRLAAAAADAWRRASGRADPHLAAAVASGPDAVDRIRAALGRAVPGEFTPQELLDRFEHFWAESEQIIPAVPDRLASSNLERFGELVDRSQGLASRLLGNQVPQTEFLAASARRLGAAAASAFGAGFGGSVWALVRRNGSQSWLDQWRDAYQKQFPEESERATFFTTEAGPAACPLHAPSLLEQLEPLDSPG